MSLVFAAMVCIICAIWQYTLGEADRSIFWMLLYIGCVLTYIAKLLYNLKDNK